MHGRGGGGAFFGGTSVSGARFDGMPVIGTRHERGIAGRSSCKLVLKRYWRDMRLCRRCSFLRGRGCRDAAPAAQAGAVDQPDERRESKKKDGPEIERRHRQRGERACSEGNRPAAPAPGQHDPVNEPLRLHGVGEGFGFGRLPSSRGGDGREVGGRKTAGSSRAAAGRRSLLR